MVAFSTFSLPEQLALSLGKDIVSGRYIGGDRLVETEVALRFSVSRGPVRDAFVLLERRRFITMEPRRGAYVRPITLDAIVDVFNIRISLFGTAARLMAEVGTISSLCRLEQSVQTIQAMAVDADTTPTCFVKAVNGVEHAVVLGSGNELIGELIRDLEQHTVWASLWMSPRHFQTIQGRERKAQLATSTGEAVQRGDGVMAESTMRRMTEYSRDEILTSSLF